VLLNGADLFTIPRDSENVWATIVGSDRSGSAFGVRWISGNFGNWVLNVAKNRERSGPRGRRGAGATAVRGRVSESDAFSSGIKCLKINEPWQRVGSLPKAFFEGLVSISFVHSPGDRHSTCAPKSNDFHPPIGQKSTNDKSVWPWLHRVSRSSIFATDSLDQLDQPLDLLFSLSYPAIHEDLCAGCVHGRKTPLDELEEWPFK
jgi:hypothetical protein